MKYLFSISVIIFSITNSFADSTSVNRRLSDVEHMIKQIEANQLNYKIEKDLLKETYSNNYDKINLVITMLLGVVGILGYLGLKDISSIKKEYEQELKKLTEIQSKFDLKSKELENDKSKFEEELKSIIKENEIQNKKIKFIEFKDKVRILIKDDQLTSALEFANMALSIQDDIDLLNQKGRLLCRLNQMNDAADTFKKARLIDPNDQTTIYNTVECLYFAKDIEGAKRLINEHKTLFESKEDGRLLELFNILELYHKNDKEKLLLIAKSYVSFDNMYDKIIKTDKWDFIEMVHFIYFQPHSELKTILQNIIWFWDGQITGERLLSSLNLELPTNPT